DGIPGLGEVRRKALLRRFGSLKNLAAASAEEIAEVPGIGIRTAEAIVAALAKPDSPAAAGQPDSSALSAQPDPSAAAATPDSAAVLAEPGPSPGQGEPPAGSAAEPESAEPAGDRAGLG